MLGFLFLMPLGPALGIQVETPVLTDSGPAIVDPIFVADPDNSKLTLLIYGLNPDPDVHTIIAYSFDESGSLRGFEVWTQRRGLPTGDRYARRLALDFPPAGRVQLVLQEARFADGQVWRCSEDKASLCPEPRKAADGEFQDGALSEEPESCQIPCSPTAYCSDWANWCRGNCPSVREFSCTVKCGECSFKYVCS